MLEPIKRTKTYEEIVKQIQNLIYVGKLKPGDKIPSERALAEELYVGRPAVREALRALESMGYIETQPGNGTYVSHFTMKTLINPVSMILSQNSRMMEDVLEYRLILESNSVALAAERATDEQIKLLDAAYAQMKQEVNAGEDCSGSDERFHSILAQSTNNEAIYTIFQVCSNLLSGTIKSVSNIPGQARIGLNMHQAILDAVKKKDSITARKLMYKHISDLFVIHGYPIPDYLSNL